jgi:heme oxygenase
MSLKDLTWEHHKNAERQEFVKVLMGGNIAPETYATFLFNQHPCYNLLEVIAMAHGLFDDIPEVRRAPRIFEDYEELWEDKENPPPLLNVTKEYTDHIMSIKDDKEKIMAHLYVRHMGDLSGGQMIKKKVPGKGTMYEFDGEVNDLKTKIRAKIHDGLADEAKICFDFATKAFKEMMEHERND